MKRRTRRLTRRDFVADQLQLEADADFKRKQEEFIAAHPEGFGGVDTRLLLAAAGILIGGKAERVGVQLLAEHVLARLPALLAPEGRKPKGHQ
jgi:hypothetical protein